jgi:glycosyltransferase involved in cell wall biosynthesis
MPATRKPRLVIAGQVPPPYGGQNVMVARLLAAFRRDGRFACEHLVFNFTPDFKSVRHASVEKVLELARVVGRLCALRIRGPIDLLIFPAGGPQTVPIVRDILLLPWVLLASRRVVLQFHAAGIADRFAQERGPLRALLSFLYRRCFAAVVMTEFNRRDPQFFGIPRIAVLPHRLPDEFDPALVRRKADRLRLLYVGHLCPDKGTPALLRAFQTIAAQDPAVVLELVGECLPPLGDAQLRGQLRELGIETRVELSGVLTGRAKQEAFARADLFVFPTVAAYESFGLVLIEAMMWGLPIVATDWRGNRDVLGREFEGLCHPTGPDLAAAIAVALTEALEKVRAGSAWIGRNRQIFLDRYCETAKSSDYPRVALRWLDEETRAD